MLSRNTYIFFGDRHLFDGGYSVKAAIDAETAAWNTDGNADDDLGS